VSVERISREVLKAKLERGEDVELVEALGEARYEEAHLPGATNIPYDRVDELAPRLLPDKGVQIPVYCSNGPCRNSE
jgi:rhodanese-related sulfurtransferase